MQTVAFFVLASALFGAAFANLSDCACPKMLDWVCGNDGRTYTNPCMLKCAVEKLTSSKGADLAIAHKGRCAKNEVLSGLQDCLCTKIMDPVCGNDLVTYSNPCMLNCAKVKELSSKGLDLEIQSEGECPMVFGREAADCGCSKAYDPVCGSDGRSYSNECVLDCSKDDSPKGADLAVAHRGECHPVAVMDGTCVCPFLWAPVCGNDFVTYDNKCFLKCTRDILGTSSKGAALEVFHAGVCEDVFADDISDSSSSSSESSESMSSEEAVF